MILPFIAASWLLGIAVVAIWHVPAWVAGAIFLALVPVAGLRFGRMGAGLTAIAAVAALIGGLRFGGWYDRPQPDLARYVGRETAVSGRIDSEASPGTTTVSYRFAVDHLQVGEDWVATDGRLVATFEQYAAYLPGDRLTLAGKIEAPPSFPDFDYRGYLARSDTVATMLFPQASGLSHGSRWQPARLAAGVRDRLESSLDRSIPEPEASLAAGIAIGRDGNIPDDLYGDFRTTGLAHIVAVSGSNVSILAALVFVLFTPLIGRRYAAIPAVATVAAYLAVAGLSASVLRAGIMAGVFLLGQYLGRQQNAVGALGAAAIAMTAVQPAAAVDPGFQLSLAATGGLIVFGPWISAALEHALARLRLLSYIPRFVVQAASLSLSATLATIPIVWVDFGQVSIVGLLTNLIVEPLFALAFALSGVTAVIGLLSIPAGRAAGLVAYLPLSFMTWLAREGARLPFAAISVNRGGAAIAFLAYVVLGAVAIPAYLRLAPAVGRPAQSPAHFGRIAAVSFGCAMVVVFVLRIGPLATAGSGQLEFTALDIGQGDAVLITTPHGHRWLVDGGPSGIELARELGAVLPPNDRAIDRIFVSHAQLDHLGGLPAVLERYDVGAEFDNGQSGTSGAYWLYIDDAPHRMAVEAGYSYSEDGVSLEVLWPPPGYDDHNTNNDALVIRITYGATRILLTGDTEAPAQLELMKQTDVRAGVLKVPHHGSKTSSPEFLAAVAPQIAVIPVGAGNSYGHPHQETLDALDGATILRTDTDGRVTIFSDGTHLRARTER